METIDIINYMDDFYGKSGIYSDIFENKLTREMIEYYLEEFLTLYNGVSVANGFEPLTSFGTPQREYYRDWLLREVFNKPYTFLEYATLIAEMRDYRVGSFINLKGEKQIGNNLNCCLIELGLK